LGGFVPHRSLSIGSSEVGSPKTFAPVETPRTTIASLTRPPTARDSYPGDGGLAPKLGTTELRDQHEVTGCKTDIGKAIAGDALKKAGSDVRLVVDTISNPEIRMIVMESTTARSCTQCDGTVGLCEGVCECVRAFQGRQGLGGLIDQSA
jgi:hypothetical protein